MQIDVQCKVEGMTCGNCALSVSGFLKKKGAENIVVNPATGDVSFSAQENSNIENIYDGIDNLGFKVVRETHTHEPEFHSKVKPLLVTSAVFWLPLMAHMFLSWRPLHEPWVQFVLALPVYIIGIFYFGKSALRSVKNGIPNMDVLVFISSTAAFFYSVFGWYLHPHTAHHYLFFETAASIITLVLAGNFLEEYAVRTTSSSIQELMKYQKTKARLVLTDSIGKESIIEIENDEIKLGDILQINTGDKIPADGIILSGSIAVDESMMTGESAPVEKSLDEEVTGGTVVTKGNVRMRATAVGSQTAIAGIIKLVNQAQAAKPPMQKLADKISAIFVPVVLVIAILTFLINYFLADVSAAGSMMRSIAVMVIACPCAMGLATPAAIMVGLGRAARNGILVKGGDALEKMKDIRQFVFDKTGTLTTGKLNIDEYRTSLQENEFKRIVFSLENYSSHPIAKSIVNEWKQNEPFVFKHIEETKGIGLTAIDEEGNEWKIGSFRILDETPSVRHDLYLLKNKKLAGWINMKDELRADAKQIIQILQSLKYKTVLLSGDRKEKCEAISAQLGIDEVHSEQMPADKLNVLEQLMKKGVTAMVGDGINDAPALTKADIGISLSDASQIAMQSADVILLKNNLSRLPEAISLGKHTYLTIKQNLFWAFFYNVLAIPVAACGLLTPTWGAGIMALSDIVLIINSVRLRYKRL